MHSQPVTAESNRKHAARRARELISVAPAALICLAHLVFFGVAPRPVESDPAGCGKAAGWLADPSPTIVSFEAHRRPSQTLEYLAVCELLPRPSSGITNPEGQDCLFAGACLTVVFTFCFRVSVLGTFLFRSACSFANVPYPCQAPCPSVVNHQNTASRAKQCCRGLFSCCVSVCTLLARLATRLQLSLSPFPSG